MHVPHVFAGGGGGGGGGVLCIFTFAMSIIDVFLNTEYFRYFAAAVIYKESKPNSKPKDNLSIIISNHGATTY